MLGAHAGRGEKPCMSLQETRLIEQEFAANPHARVMLFHESIAEVMSLFAHLRQRGFAAIAEHSELPGSVRETGLDLFRRGIAQIIASARSLIEGVNVPAVDVGIIVASSSSEFKAWAVCSVDIADPTTAVYFQQ
jgi:superfamily II DNA or RNA helicase